MSANATLESCPLVQSAEEYRLAFGRLAHDKLLHNGAGDARKLAYALASATDIYEFFAISRYVRRSQPDGERTAPLMDYLSGLHFYRVHRCDNLEHIDFEALKEAAWQYVDFLESL